MHRDVFRFHLTNTRRLFEYLPPWQNEVYFVYNHITSDVKTRSRIKKDTVTFLKKRISFENQEIS